MRRREFITLLGGAATGWPLAATAQQAAGMVRLGYLGFATAVQNSRSRNAFLAGLRDLGYVEGKNFQIEFRYADGDNDLLAGLAAELVRLNVDVIVTYATGVPVAQRATSTIPVVMVGYTDAVATGMIASLAHPGGNVTGSTFFHPELMAKRLELLKELTPSIDRAGAFLFRRSEANGPILKAMGNTARTLGVTLHPIELDKPTDLEGAFSALASQQVRALVSGDHSFFNANSDAIAVLAAKHRVLSVGALELAANGGLMAYGVNFSDQFRRAAVFVDKILKGAKAGDIPVEQASKFTTIINIKTAKALGIEMPTSLLLRADEVIE